MIKNYIRHKQLMFMLLPVLAYYIIFHYIPMYGVVIAFQDFIPLKGIFGSQFVGFENFKTLFSGMYFLPVLRNTLLISTYKLIFGFPAPILLCLLLNEVGNKYFKKFTQTVSYLPHFISWVVLAGIVIEVLSPSRGVVNYFIELFGFRPIYFLGEPKYFRSILVISSIWKSVGWSSVVYLAAITNIDPELYDVADIDGCGRLKKIWYITLPSITSVIVIMFIFAIGGIINDDFDQVFNLLNAQVMSVGNVISTYTYTEGIQKLNYSYASAVGLFKNVIAFALVMTANSISRKFSDYSIW